VSLCHCVTVSLLRVSGCHCVTVSLCHCVSFAGVRVSLCHGVTVPGRLYVDMLVIPLTLPFPCIKAVEQRPPMLGLLNTLMLGLLNTLCWAC